MNSESLKENHVEIYKKFFNTYDLIISSPIIFSITSMKHGFLKWNSLWIRQKIPLRNYIGVNFSEKKNNKIDYFYKENINSKFEVWKLENNYPIDKKTLEDMWIKNNIWFLSEYNRKDPPSIISNILITKLLLDEEITEKDISKLSLNSPEFSHIYDKICKLDKKLLTKYDFFSTLRNSSYYLPWSFSWYKWHMLWYEKDNNHYYKTIKNNEKLFNIDLSIYILNPNNLWKYYFHSDVLFKRNKEIKKTMKKHNIPNINEDFIRWLESINNFYSIKIFDDLTNLYNNDHRWEDFFDNISTYKKLHNLVYSSIHNYLDIEHIEQEIKKTIWQVDSKFCVCQIWSKIVIFWNKTLKINQDIINKLNEKIWYTLTLDYNSNKDWFEIEGSKIEQFKSKWIYCNFSSKFKLSIIDESWIKNINDDYEELLTNNNTILLLDSIREKIYLNGKKLTSKDLLSQKTTVEVLTKLISNYWKEMTNKELPISSYSKNKNEMLGKIVIPLIKLIEKETKKRLPLICKWSIHDFYMKLLPNDIKIGIIEKI